MDELPGRLMDELEEGIDREVGKLPLNVDSPRSQFEV